MGPSIKSVSYMSDSIAKEKKWGKKLIEICAIKGGGVRRLMANAISIVFLEYFPPMT